MQLRTGQPIFSSCSIALLYFSQHGDRDRLVPMTEVSRKDSGLEKDLKEVIGVVEKVTKVNEGCKYSLRMFCGSHDKCVYCWNREDGRQVWRTGLHSEVYSTPVVCNLLKDTSQRKTNPQPLKMSETRRDTEPGNNPVLSPSVATISSSALACICACTTSGQVHLLDIHTGAVLGSIKLPGEVFSSPVVVDNHLLVGCRDDCVYCIECNI